ncbi:5-formaminoimidazole-4-carboxamide-1-(beta)-D-ribofuranosyl 5'-monophosphate synthetase [Candidatus Peregrinibacteria bacterium RIFOXYC2_FULL_33_13]|nr:MAG: 5-formaminoimidazole-4-carboxamide-1-(beta)-D-ribofuranosyl 5'-monophosphate synthetase [Candidatus Peregrinibacteria bacterium GW2011_GWA2_33_10]KKP38783.1 MAG: phosphoribosylaminoimidazolecarboxamide formyltransferase, 5-formaminoimidazole-4-carboxamide-1-(beta)-D-ribofuranosyl 5'-monophosphate synthetase [Candidatus Peregrinibacteria bacterium GW2011_GWC2_33_13]OGJ50616.1 MAG: 5-formaminoimidazole-4-carboxamide-1-(beta)-D-ribofuranosyl 5'-monophosphate synthetase [Candidatus Peregrinib
MGNIKDYAIATIGSHSALQILKGAKDEGIKTICICKKGAEKIYKQFNVADELIVLDNFDNFEKLEDELISKNAIIIPHGSFISYLGTNRVQNLRVMHFGTKEILEWESNRNMERVWLKKAGLRLPKIFNTPDEIDTKVIIKFHGASGGFGYFIAHTAEEFYERIKGYKGKEDYVIQEYIIGVPLYLHYFYSPLTDEVEIMSFDKRYESNADSIGRIAAKDQLDVDLKTSYTVTGNMPLVVRESLLPEILEMGENVVRTSKELVKGGLFGPFCLETILDPNLNFYVFEISARIVAGTNPFINGTPYTWVRYNEPMSTGRRIAREIKNAIMSDRVEEVLG